MSEDFTTPEISAGDGNDSFWTVHQGDARQIESLLGLASEQAGLDGEPFLQTTITSPPYATLVDYGSPNQIGFGQSYDEYLESCRDIFKSLYSWTLSSGSMWLVADSLMQQRRDGPSRFVPLPFQLATEAEAVGWTLREVIIWRKDRTRPWSHPGKLRNGFEYVLFFVKANDFKFNVDRLRETSSLKSWWVKYPERHNPWGMTPDNVWEIPIPVQGSWADTSLRHACPFPPELVRRMVALASDEGDVVFDPFAGSGTVVSTAAAEGRLGFGVELNEDYVAAFGGSVLPARRPAVTSPDLVAVMTQRLLELRVLKYPKDLAKQIVRSGFTSVQVRAILMTVESMNWEPATTGYASIICTVIIGDDLAEIETARLERIISQAASKPPLSKYGLTVQVQVATSEAALSDLKTNSNSGQISIYTGGRTWHAAQTLGLHEIPAWLASESAPSVVPILSPLHVEQTLEESG